MQRACSVHADLQSPSGTASSTGTEQCRCHARGQSSQRRSSPAPPHTAHASASQSGQSQPSMPASGGGSRHLVEALATGRTAGALEERSLAHRRVAAHGARARRGGRPTVLRRHLAEAPLTASAARPRHAAASSLATSRWLCAAATAAAAAPAAPGVAWRWTGATATRPAAGGARLLSAGCRRLGRAAHLRDHGHARAG
eukprot:scaffold34254_cov65-Phaeocystis_antarctica.AAC.8